MNIVLTVLLCALIGSLLVINCFLGQLIVTMTSYFLEKNRALRRSSFPDKPAEREQIEHNK